MVASLRLPDMRTLIVEDEGLLRQQLAEHVSGLGHVVDQAADGEEGLYYGTEFSYDLAIVDLGLPKLSGIDLIAQLRSRHRDFPIIVLTARDHWRDKVEGLEAGADDYLTKPFQLEELTARMNALIRRAAGHASPTIVIGALTLDTVAQGAYLDGQELTLTAFEYKLLAYLVVNAPRVISKTELTDHLYAQDFDRDSNVLEVLVGRLRRKMAPHELIVTARGRGYHLPAGQAPTAGPGAESVDG